MDSADRLIAMMQIDQLLHGFMDRGLVVMAILHQTMLGIRCLVDQKLVLCPAFVLNEIKTIALIALEGERQSS